MPSERKKQHLIFSVSHPDGVKTELMSYVDSATNCINAQMCLVTSFPSDMVYSCAGEADVRAWIADRMEEIAQAIRYTQFSAVPEPKRLEASVEAS